MLKNAIANKAIAGKKTVHPSHLFNHWLNSGWASGSRSEGVKKLLQNFRFATAYLLSFDY